MTGEIEDGVALDFKRVCGLETPPGKTNEIDVMPLGGIQQAGPDDKAGACVQACKYESKSGSVGWHGRDCLFQELSLLWICSHPQRFCEHPFEPPMRQGE